MSRDRELMKQLSAFKKAGRLRKLETIVSGSGSTVSIEGRQFINLCSNDYLNLANDKRLQGAILESMPKWGVGSGASRLLSGNLSIHEKLERKAAALVGMECALAFSSGYAANTGLLSSIAAKGDIIFSDELNHASIIDGCRLSKAKAVVYKHADASDLRKLILGSREKYNNIFIVTESYFSMDGDIAQLIELAEIAEQYNAGLIVDEAHAIGVWGKGRGLCHKLGISENITALVGTLGKALGSQGAFIAGSSVLKEFLINRARSFIYSTALAPVCAAAAIRAIEIVESSGSELEIELSTLCDTFRDALQTEGIPVPKNSVGHIVPVLFGEENLAIKASGHLQGKGYLSRAIRPPTVPEGTSRLRFSITRSLQMEDLKKLAQILGAIS